MEGRGLKVSRVAFVIRALMFKYIIRGLEIIFCPYRPRNDHEVQQPILTHPTEKIRAIHVRWNSITFRGCPML